MDGGNVADYWASFSVKTDINSLAKVDRYLSTLSQKLEKYQSKFNKSLGFEALFKVNESLLVKTLGDSLDRAGKAVTFEISKFAVNQASLRSAIKSAKSPLTLQQESSETLSFTNNREDGLLKLGITPSIDDKLLARVLGDALDRVSNLLVFEISRFSVNQANLRSAIKSVKASLKMQQDTNKTHDLVGDQEDRFLKLGITPSIDDKLLSRVLGDALDRVSNLLVFEISRFFVNERNLKASLLHSFRKVSKSLSMNVPLVTLNAEGQLSAAEWDRRRTVSKQDRLEEIEAKRKMYELGHKDRMEALRYKNEMRGSRSSAGRSNYYDAGFHVPTTSHFMRYGMDSLPFIGGAIGLAALNKHSQTLQANDMALSASAGNSQDAKKYSEFLNNLGERLGKTTATMTPFFSQMLAGAKGTKLEPHLMEGFTSLMEYSSVMMLDDEKVKGTIRAFTQMIGKQQIMAEELRGQAAEHLPPIVRLMADVAAGGDTKKLNEMMSEGKLDPNVHLPMLFKRLREESAPLLPKYFKTSVFAQGYMGKQAEDLLKAFSQNGGDSGFARIFKEMAEAFKKLEPLTKSLGRAFDDLSKALQAPIRLFGDLGPLVTDVSNMFGTSESNVLKFAVAGGLLATKWGRVGFIFEAIALVLQDISFGVQGKDSYTKDFFDWIEKFTPIEKKLMGVSAALLAIATAMKAISINSKLPGLGSVLGGGGSSDKGGKGKKNAGRFGLFGALGVAGVTAGLVGYGLDQAGVFDRAASIKDQRTALYGEIQNPYSPLYQDTNVDKAWSQYREGQERSGGTADFQSWLNNYVQQRTANAENKYGTVPLMAQYQNHKEEQQAIQQTNNITVNANIEVKAENPEEGARKFSQMLQNELTNTLQFFNNTR